MTIIRVVKKFRQILSRDQKSQIAKLVVLMLIGGAVETLSVGLIIPFMNAVVYIDTLMDRWYVKKICEFLDIHHAYSFMFVGATCLGLLFIAKNVYLMIEYKFQYRFIYENMFDMQNRLLKSLISNPYEYFLQAETGDTIRLINVDIPSTFNLLETLLSFFTESIVSLMLIMTILFIMPKITLVIGVILLIFLLAINFFIKPKMRKLGEETGESSSGMNKWLIQSIQGIKEMKVTNTGSFFLENFSRYGRSYIDTQSNYLVISVIPRFMIESICMSSMFFAIALLIFRGGRFDDLVPLLTAVAMAAVRLLPSVNRISTSMTRASYGEPILDRVILSLQELNNEKRGVQRGENAASTPRLKDTFKMDGISYGYPGSSADVLMNANLEIRKGESIGIVGESGAGKTTVVDIIMGLLGPREGRVLVDGQDINVDLEGWYKQIGYIPQMIFMLDDTIRANVVFGREEMGDDTVWKALEEAALRDFVKNLPEGLDTKIGERGIRLSGGQRQRIGIARALYLDPEILIMDEATSALDNETEKTIMDSIDNLIGKKTMIIIAHRLTTIKHCDHVYAIKDRKVLRER